MIKSAEEFKALCESPIPDEYSRVITDNASLEVWHDVLRKYSEDYMKYNVLLNDALPMEIKYILSDDEDDYIRSCLASRKDLDDFLYDKLSRDAEAGVRGSSTILKRLPLERLQEMQKDASDWVRYMVHQELRSRGMDVEELPDPNYHLINRDYVVDCTEEDDKIEDEMDQYSTDQLYDMMQNHPSVYLRHEASRLLYWREEPVEILPVPLRKLTEEEKKEMYKK